MRPVTTLGSQKCIFLILHIQAILRTDDEFYILRTSCSWASYVTLLFFLVTIPHPDKLPESVGVTA
jgi:fucose 4-O-acetylase-like acetyltransferase